MCRLKDVDKDTFARFCRFAYTGDYAETAPDIVLDWNAIGEEPNGLTPPIEEEPRIDEETLIEQMPAEPEPVPAAEPDIPPDEDPWEAPLRKTSKGKKKNKKGKNTLNHSPMRMEMERPREMRSMELWESFAKREHSCVVPALLVPSRPNTEACEDYTPVFMCHSSLYVFGDKQRVADVAELVRYTYVNTLDSHDEPLRSLVAQYIAANVESLAGAPEFDDLLQEPGPHAKDLVCLMVGRLNVLK